MGSKLGLYAWLFSVRGSVGALPRHRDLSADIERTNYTKAPSPTLKKTKYKRHKKRGF